MSKKDEIFKSEEFQLFLKVKELNLVYPIKTCANPNCKKKICIWNRSLKKETKQQKIDLLCGNVVLVPRPKQYLKNLFSR
jgi:hypothetical protein